MKKSIHAYPAHLLLRRKLFDKLVCATDQTKDHTFSSPYFSLDLYYHEAIKILI